MSNDTLMLLFQAGLFLIELLTLIVAIIDKISKKIAAQVPIGKLLFFIVKIQ